MKLERKWTRLKGFGGMYIISNYGEVARKSYNIIGKDGREYIFEKKLIKGGYNNSGYPIVNLKDVDGRFKCLLRHKLVAEHFISNPDNLPTVGFKDGNRENIKVTNLYWTTTQEAKPMTDIVPRNFGENHYNANLDSHIVKLIYMLTLDPAGYKNTEIVKIMKDSFNINVNHRTVSNIRYKYQWKSVLEGVWFDK